MTWVFDESPAAGNDRLVLLAIADEAADDGTNAYPSVDLIAHKTRIPERTVYRCLDRLEGGAQLLIRRPEVRGRGHHNRYIVVMGRNPLALAGQHGWPPPNLTDDITAEWCQSDTLPEPSPSVGNPVDGDHENPRKPANRPPKSPRQGGSRRIDPYTHGVAGRRPVDAGDADPTPPAAPWTEGRDTLEQLRHQFKPAAAPPPEPDGLDNTGTAEASA